MLGKVMKYDFKEMGKRLLPFYLVMLLLSVIEKIGSVVNEHYPIFSTVYGMFTFLYVVVLIASFFYTFWVGLQSFYKAFMKDEGYFINTLPVTKEKLVFSKTIAATVYLLFTTVVTIFSVLIAIMDMDVMKGIGEFVVQLIEKGIGIDATIILFLVAFILLFSYIQQLLFIYFALALGQTRSSHKITYSFVFGFVIYFVTQIVTTVALLGLGLCVPEIRTAMFNAEATFSNQAIISLLIWSVVTIVITCGAYFFGTTYTLKKKLNLD